MANTNNAIRPSGFSPVGYLNGAPWNGQANLYYINSSDTTNYFIGDPVKSAAYQDVNGVTGVAIAAAGDTIRGVIVGFLPAGAGAGPQTSLVGTPLSLEVLRGTASTTRYALVADDPMIIFKAQMTDGTLGNSKTLSTAANLNCDFVVNSLTTTGTLSNATLDETTTATTASSNTFKLLGLFGADNGNITDLTATTGDYTWWKCKINMHELTNASASI